MSSFTSSSVLIARLASITNDLGLTVLGVTTLGLMPDDLKSGEMGSEDYRNNERTESK